MKEFAWRQGLLPSAATVAKSSSIAPLMRMSDHATPMKIDYKRAIFDPLTNAAGQRTAR
jgi:hypothetical protein